MQNRTFSYNTSSFQWERWMRRSLMTIAFITAALLAFSQSVIYSTNFGTANVTTATLQTGWVRSGAQAANLTLSTASASSGYTNPAAASGGANLAEGNSSPVAGTSIVTVDGVVNTTGFTSIQVLFAARKTSAFAGTVTLEWSNDGISWNAQSFADVANTSSWLTANGGSWINLPSGAENQANLRFRFTFVRPNGSGNYRIDDFVVRGISATPSVSATSTTGFFTNVGTPSAVQNVTVSGTNLTANVVLNVPAGYEIRETAGIFGSSVTLSPTLGTLSATNVEVRLTGATAGSFTGNLTVSSTGATTQNVALSGTVIGAPVSFTSGNLVVLQVGNGTSALSASAAPLYLRELSPAGSYVQMIALPTADSGPNQQVVLSGSSTSEGSLTLSENGQYLTLAGYDAAVGTANVNSTAGINRVIASITQTGSINTTTTITDGFTGNNIRGAVTVDGSGFWATGAGTGGGVRYAVNGNTSTSTLVSSTTGNTRVPVIENNQLYVSSASGSVGINVVGTGTPTNSGNTMTLLGLTPAVTDAYGFVFLDRDAGVAGNDVLYIANNAGLLKFSFDGSTWTARGSVAATGITGIAASVNGANADIFVSGPTAVSFISDNAAFNANITGSLTTIMSAPAGTVFRGLAFAPFAAPSCTFFQDLDNDGFGNSAVTQTALCSSPPVGYVSVGGDCNDGNNLIFPGATELPCDGLDNDCDVSIDETFVAGCNDILACNYNPSATCAVGCDFNPQTWYRDQDNDTYGDAIDFQVACTQPVGYVLLSGDCNDNNAAVNPGVTEILCNFIDDNCNTVIDEGSVSGCTNPNASNFNPLANCDNGTCIPITSFGAGNVVVLRVGDGTSVPNSAANRVFVDQVSPTGTLVSSFAVPHTAGPLRLVTSTSATSEGQITLSADRTAIAIAGYDAAPGTANVNSTAGIDRVIGVIDNTYSYSLPARSSTFNTGNNLRSALKSGNNFWATGGAGGVNYYGTGTPAAVNSAPISNFRTLGEFNGELFVSTGSGTTNRGIWRIGGGSLPTSTATATQFLATGSSSSPYAFVFSPDGNTLYVADDRTGATGGGILKYTFNGAVWTLAATFNLGAAFGASGVFVDFYTEQFDVVYAVIRDTGTYPNVVSRLVRFNDDGSASGATTPTLTTLATAAANTYFRSVTGAPGVNTTWYRDIDGDGFGNALDVITYTAQPFGYVAQAGDCNDTDNTVFPGAVEICGNGIDNDCDLSIDEGCGNAPTNDTRAGALTLSGNQFPSCSTLSANLSSANNSPEALTSEPIGAGQDVWYQFVAQTNGVRIQANSSACNLVLELQNAAGTTLIASENETSTGSEILVANNLIAGQTYYLAIRNFSTTSVGSFTYCIQHLRASQPDNGTTFSSLCSFIKARWTGASLYTITFTNGPTVISASSSSTQIPFSAFAGLQYNTTYSVVFTSTFNQVDAAGNPTQVVVNSVPFNVTIAPHPLANLRSIDRCPITRSIGSFIGTDIVVCGITEWEWEFQEVDANDNLIAPTPTLVESNTTSRFIRVSNIPGVIPGSYYRVRVRPVFASGPGVFPVGYFNLCVAGSGGMIIDNNAMAQERSLIITEEVTAVSMELYPNPNRGDMFQLVLNDGEHQIRITDAMGRVVYTNRFVVEGVQTINVLMEQKLASGIYQVESIEGGERTVVRMMVD